MRNEKTSRSEKSLRDAVTFDAYDGRSFEEKKADLLDVLRRGQDRVGAESVRPDEGQNVNIKEQFWRNGETIDAGPHLVLRNVIEADRDGFLELQRTYSTFKGMLKEDTYCDLIWREHTEDKTIPFSIVCGGEYIGYCAIKDTSCEVWEIATELKTEWTGRGIGHTAVVTMLNEIKARLGVAKYRVRIEPTNYQSQRLVERLGAVPNGISELWIHDPKMLEQCEEENLQFIDDRLIAVADKFGVPPRKLLSHVLEYTLHW